MKGIVLFCLIFGWFSMFYQSSGNDHANHPNDEKFDTLKYVGYEYDHNGLEQNECDNYPNSGSVFYDYTRVANVSECKYQVYVDKEIVTKIEITTFSEQSKEELMDLAVEICPEFESVRSGKGKYYFRKDIEFSGKECVFSFKSYLFSKESMLTVELL